MALNELNTEMQRERKRKSRQRFVLFLSLSLFFHLFVLFISPQLQMPQQQVEEKPVVIELDQALLKQLNKQQIVQSEDAKNNEAPKEAKYLGRKNQTVKKQTRAKVVDRFRKANGKQAKKRFKMKDLAPKHKFEPPKPGEFAQKKKFRRPQQQAPQASGQNAANNDYLKEKLAEGDRSLLSTKEFQYFGYHHRIRQKLEIAWNRNLRSVLASYFRSGRSISQDKKYITTLVVVLDRRGKVARVKLQEASGEQELDDAAVEAFNEAGPFPNPPLGLIEKDGFVRITWGFVLQS